MRKNERGRCKMKITQFPVESCPVSRWSGGSTTQIAIEPPDSEYGKRDFLWRVSSAVVELEESQFTALPDYDRWISVLEGKMELSHNGRFAADLHPGEIYAFDGGVETYSKGQCRDFNLMLRKGKCTGVMEKVSLHSGVTKKLHGESAVVIYCAGGKAVLTEKDKHWEMIKGNVTYIRDVSACLLEPANDAELMICRIQEG